MSTTERVLDYLRTQGFCPEIEEDTGNVAFKYQMVTYLYINNDDDKDFFQLTIPFIYEATEDNRDVTLEAINKTNSHYKVAKVSLLDNNVWVFFESLLDNTPEIGDIFPRALNILYGARQDFYKNLG